MTRPDKFSSSYPDISTIYELDDHMRKISKPLAAFQYNPPGGQMQNLSQPLDPARMRRVAELKENLLGAAKGLELNFALEPQKGRSKAHFNRER